MKRWLQRSWLFAVLLAAAGCGSYEPVPQNNLANSTAVAEAKVVGEQIAKTDDFVSRLAAVSSPATAASWVGMVQEHSKELKEAVYARRRLPPSEATADRKELDAKLLESTNKLRSEVDRILKIPEMVPEMTKALKEGMDGIAQAYVVDASKIPPAPPAPPAPKADECPWWASLVFSLLLFAIGGGCVAFLLQEGIWSNAIRLVIVIFAGLMAMNFYEPLSAYLTEQLPAYSPVFDLLTLWAIFIVCTLVSRELTDRISRIQVRFLGVADRVGGIVLSCWIGWVMVCFTVASLHTAPLARNFFFGAFDGDRKMFLGVLAPDREWLAFMRRMSQGALSRSDAPAEQFDANSEFPATHGQRRINMEAYIMERGGVLIDDNFVKK